MCVTVTFMLHLANGTKVLKVCAAVKSRHMVQSLLQNTSVIVYFC